MSHDETISPPPFFEELPFELHIHILTYLRAYDLSAVQLTCRYFASRSFISSVIQHTAEHVYPPSLTRDFFKENDYTFESLRNMEWLVVARVLNQPEPSAGFYVSKSWCRTALKWLEVNQAEQAAQQKTKAKKKKKLSKKEQRLQKRQQKITPPWPNVNSDLVCCHDNLECVKSSKSARARRRLMDKQAWKVLKKLFPDSVSLESNTGECIQCTLDLETQKRELQQLEDAKKEERRKPLSCPIVRGIYSRTRGVPTQNMVASASACPLQPGLYGVLPRAWLHGWRKYLKNGEGPVPLPPDSSSLLCHAHRLPLLPPHLEAYLNGEISELFASVSIKECLPVSTPPPASMTPVGYSPIDSGTLSALRAAGVTQAELDAQTSRYRSLSISSESDQPPPPVIHGMQDLVENVRSPPAKPRRTTNELMDKENRVVVEILTDEEISALETWWPTINFALRFGVAANGDITWSTLPCRSCDATGRNIQVSMRNRNRRGHGTSFPYYDY